MATVRDISNPKPLDKSYAAWNRSGSATPVNAVTPLYVGEIYKFTTTTGTLFFRATGLTTGDWIGLTQAQNVGA